LKVEIDKSDLLKLRARLLFTFFEGKDKGKAKRFAIDKLIEFICAERKIELLEAIEEIPKEYISYVVSETHVIVKHCCKIDEKLKEINEEVKQMERMAYITVVFEFWRKELDKKGASLTEPRKARISKALESFSVEELRKAILGVKMSDFHMGNNDQKTPYNELDNIFRSEDKIRMHIQRFERKKNTGTKNQIDAILEETRKRINGKS
jgi:metal-responsive CopG/Arc/MetJ family transcriptional regulator